MTLEQAIEKAIDGGYQPIMYESSDSHYSDIWIFIGGFDYCIPEIVLDPLFWQALGKSEGWEKSTTTFTVKKQEISDCSGRSYVREKHTVTRPVRNAHNIWLKKWHRFIDHLAEGKTIDSYFETL